MMSKAELLYASKVTVAFTSLVAVTEHNTVLTGMKTLHWAGQWEHFKLSRDDAQNIKITQMKLERREKEQQKAITNLIFFQLQKKKTQTKQNMKLDRYRITSTSRRCTVVTLAPFSRTMFMSMPLVYVHACWKYSSSLCRSGFGIWWKRMNSLTRSIWRWYLAVLEYSLWMMADTFPKMLAYIRAGREALKLTVK